MLLPGSGDEEQVTTKCSRKWGGPDNRATNEVGQTRTPDGKSRAYDQGAGRNVNYLRVL